MSGRSKSNFFKAVCAASLMFAGAYTVPAQSAVQTVDLLLDSGDSLSGWTTGTGNTSARDTQIKVIGSSSLKSVGSARDRFRKLFSTPVDITRYRYLTFWYFVDRPDFLSSTTDLGQIEISSGSTFDVQEWSWSIRDLHLQRGWNYVVLDLPGRNTGDAVPINPQRVNYFRIYHRPTTSITTRIDNIVFTNREPRSFAFAAYLEQKRIAASATAVVDEDDVFAFLQSTTAGSAERAKSCRRLTIELTQREINAETLKGLGVSAPATFAEISQRRFLKDVMCGLRTFPTRDSLIGSRLQLAAADIAVIGEIATLFDLPMDAAARTKQQLLDVDLSRILSVCASKATEVDNYIRTGAVQSVFPGANVLVQQCPGTPLQIAGLLGAQTPAVNDRKATYKQCMSVFEQQGAQCDNAYSNPDEEYEYNIKKIHPDEMSLAAARLQMKSMLDVVGPSFTVNDGRVQSGATHADANAPNFERLEGLHEEYDRNRGRVASLDIFMQGIEGLQATFGEAHLPDGSPSPLLPTIQQGYADLTRLWEEKQKYSDQVHDLGREICIEQPDDPICVDSDLASAPPAGPRFKPEVPDARCASMNVNGLDAWFDKPPGASGLASQIDEGDRIDHCLCELFDRNYSAKLPGNTLTQVGNCPTPEERIAQKCLENPYTGVDGIKKECLHLMQPISTDRDSLGARLCSKINPGCNAAYMNDDGSCGCGSRQTNGTILVPGRTTGIPNCDAVGGIPLPSGGCEPFNSGANACAAGGKDYYLVRDPANDLKARIFASKIPGQTLLVPRTGSVRIVTPAIKRSQLFNSTTLSVRAMRLNAADDGTGQLKVYCKNSTSLGTSREIQSIALSTISTTTPTVMSINLDAAEVTACYRNNANSNVYFEFFADTKANQPVAFFDILGELGNIKPQCSATPRPNSPTPGPRPLTSWPATYTFGDGVTITPKFLGVGPMPTPTATPPPATLPPLCVVDGVVVPCR